MDLIAREVVALRCRRRTVAEATQAVSRGVANIEKVLVTAFVAAIFALILLNIATRAAGRPLIWVDELAIYLMVATCFVGTWTPPESSVFGQFLVQSAEDRTGGG